MTCTTCGNPVDSIHRFCPKCGAPMQFQSPSPQPSGSPYNAPPPYSAPPPMMGGPAPLPPRRSSSCGKIVIIALIILVLLGVGIAGAIYYGYRYTERTLKSSEAYTVAVNALKENAEVKEKLGEIQDTGFPLGAYSQDASGSGAAAFVMSVQGSKAKGSYQVELTRSNSVWRIKSGIVKTADGETIQVVERTPEITIPTVNTNTNEVNINDKDAIKGGVLNAKAISLPQPAYPAAAKVVKASGTVVVQVLVDEKGNVISARPISGHPMLRAAAVAAARSAKFTPTVVGGKPVKVSGTLTYTFTAETP